MAITLRVDRDTKALDEAREQVEAITDALRSMGAEGEAQAQRIAAGFEEQLKYEKALAEAIDKRRRKKAESGEDLLDMAKSEKPYQARRSHLKIQEEERQQLDLSVVGLAKYGATMNLLPRGYEMWTVRTAQTLSSLGKLNIVLGIGAAGALTLKSAISKAASDPSYQGFDRLAKNFDNTSMSVSRMTDRFEGFVGMLARGVKLANDWVAIPLAETVSGMSGGNEMNELDMARARKATDASRMEAKAFADARRGGLEMDDRLFRIGRGDPRREAIIEGAKSFGTERATRDRLNAAEIAKNEEAVKRLDQDRRTQMDILGTVDKDSAAAKRAQEKLAEIKAEADAYNARTVAIRRSAEAEDAASEVRLVKERVRWSRDLAQIEEKRSGKAFEARRVISLEQVNQQLDEEIKAVNELVNLNALTDKQEEELAKRRERVNALMERRTAEMDKQRQAALQMADIAARAMDSGDDTRIDEVRGEAAERQRIRDTEKQRIEMLRSGGILSDRQAHAAERELIERNDSLKTLKETQRIEKERLERNKKITDELERQAQTVEEMDEVRQRRMQQANDQAQMETRHAREQLAAQREIADIKAAQARDEETRRQQQAVENMREAVAARQKAMTGEGGVLSRIQGRITPQQQNLRMWQQRSVEAMAAERKRLGRNLSKKEQAAVIEKQRQQMVRQLRGPSAADQRRELGRQRKAERDRIKAERQKMAALPPGMRRAAMQGLGQEQQAGEADRMRAAQSGDLARGMNADFRADQASTQEQMTNQAIQTMQQNGQITEQMAQTMQNAASVMANMERELAVIQNTVTTIDAQIQTIFQSGQRRAAQRQGGGR